MDLNATVAASQHESGLFESCLSTSSLPSLNAADNDVMHEPYFESLQLSANDTGKLHRWRNVRGGDVVRRSPSPQSSSCSQVPAAVVKKSDCPREVAKKDDITALNRNHFVAAVTDMSEPDSLLNRTFSSLHVSTDNSIGQSWISSDLTAVTPSSDSFCSLHSVRIERQVVADSDNDNRCSLVEAVLIPTDHDEANTSCQHENLECSYLSDDRTFLPDWKTASETEDDEANVEVTVPASVKSLSAAELRSRLCDFGQSPGPVVKSTRHLHELRLSRLMAGSNGHKTSAENSLSTGVFYLFSLFSLMF